jgi:hypothetical protein
MSRPKVTARFRSTGEEKRKLRQILLLLCRRLERLEQLCEKLWFPVLLAGSAIEREDGSESEVQVQHQVLVEGNSDLDLEMLIFWLKKRTACFVRYVRRYDHVICRGESVDIRKVRHLARGLLEPSNKPGFATLNTLGRPPERFPSIFVRFLSLRWTGS